MNVSDIRFCCCPVCGVRALREVIYLDGGYGDTFVAPCKSCIPEKADKKPSHLRRIK